MPRWAKAACILVVLLVGGAGCGGSDPPSLDQGREAWMEAEGADKQDLARTCRARAATEVGEKTESAQTRQRIESLDLDALIGRIDEWYAQDRPNRGPIYEVCLAEAGDLASTAIQSEIEQIEEEMAP